MTHTETPWRIETWHYNNRPTLVIQNDTHAVAQMTGIYRAENTPEQMQAEERANAELIVRAVNAHEALVALAERVVRNFADTDAPILVAAEEALALAKGEK